MRIPGGGSFTDQPFGNGGSRDRQRDDRDDEEDADPEPEPEPEPEPSPAERFRGELGGDPVDGGSDPSPPDDIQREDPGAPSGGESGAAEPGSGGSRGGGSGPQSPPAQDGDSSGSSPADGFGDELGGDPVGRGNQAPASDEQSSSTNEPTPSGEFGQELGGDPTGGSQPSGPLDALVEDTLNPAAETFDQQVAETAGEAIRAASPATLVDSQVPGGNPVGRGIENTVRGAANVVNVPGIAAGAIRAGQRAADDTARVDEQGAEGRQQNRQELAADLTGAAAATGAAIQQDPVGTLSRIGGSAVGGAAVGGVASRAARGLRGTGNADVGGSGSAVPSGRSNVGTGGVDSVLEDIDVDQRRGVSGPSRRSRLEADVSRNVDEVRDRVNEFVESGGTDRGQLQLGSQGRGTGDSDVSDARDRTRPANAGGSFEDVRQDALTQIQDDLGGRARAPDPGSFDNAAQPFRSGSGDTIDADGSVSLERTSGVVDDPDTATASSSASGAGAAGVGLGLGTLSGVNDPTGIAGTSSPAAGTRGPAQIVGADGDLGGAGGVSETTDPSGVAPGVRDQLGDGRLGGGTLPGDVTGTDTATDTESEAATQTDTDTDVGTGSGAGTDTGSDTDTPLTTPITDPTSGSGGTTPTATGSAASAASFNDSGGRRARTPELPELFGGEEDKPARSSGQDSFTFGFDPEVGIFGEDL